MRCPFEERLRRIRKREKDERKRVIEERKQKRDEDRSELISSGKTTAHVEIKDSSWEEYAARIKKDFEEKTAKRKKEEAEGVERSSRRIGPVVPERTPPLIYRYRVDMYKRRLDEQDAFLMQETKIEDGKIKECEVQTVKDAEQKKETAEMDCQTDELEEKQVAEEEDVDDEEYWDEEYWDEEEEEEEEDEAVEERRRIPQGHLDQLGAGYLRNIHFQAATQSYLDMMNSFVRNFEN
uniref:Protein MAK16 homolog n=1 Tax=Caenorhabditis tropicalis TaxID=1561998 RepID=A0A1I7ULU9_9PELO